MKTAPSSPAARAEAVLREHALSYPGAREDFPWGEAVMKVGRKVFVFFGRPEGGLSLSVKLPGSAILALDLPFASPTAYGLGKSGWVTARFAARERPPIDLLRRWIDESYRAVAPTRLRERLEGARRPSAPPARLKVSATGGGRVRHGARDGSGARGAPGGARGRLRRSGGGGGRRPG